MKTSIYHRIPDLPTDELKLMIRLWGGMVANREQVPMHHDYHGKCLMRAALELEQREVALPRLNLRDRTKKGKTK